VLFVGDDWAEAHHDVELMDASGRRLAKARLPEGVAGMARLHAMISEQFGEAAEDVEQPIRQQQQRPGHRVVGCDLLQPRARVLTVVLSDDVLPGFRRCCC
jgi:hypothetical protein